jgi:ABC-type nickel/cobalt efflux system permease component RcnA
MLDRRHTTRISRLICGLLAFAVISVCPSFTLGHPLGNFTISHFARLNIGRDEIKLHYVIDMAEYPSFQELQKISADGHPPAQAALDAYSKNLATEYVRSLVLRVDNSAVPLTVISSHLTRAQGLAGMETLRIECDFSGVLPTASTGARTLSFEDQNYSERIGWREIVVQPESGIAVFNSSVYGSSLSDELKSYPREMFAAPLNERVADLSFVRGMAPAGTRPLLTRSGATAVAARSDRLSQLIQLPNLTIGVALLAMLTALLWGGLHALSPGHGKTVVAAYLIGARGTVRHALFLGLTVTITHTAGVIALGLLTLLASAYIRPERLFGPLQLASGIMVLAIGFTLFRRRLAAALGLDGSHTHVNGVTHSHSPGGGHQHLHDHAVDHRHDGMDSTLIDADGGRPHSHLPPGADGQPITWRSLLGLGVAGGILPCPSALVVLLASIYYQRTGFGLLLVFAFSVGLAGVLSAVGILFVYAGRILKPVGRFYRLEQVLPIFSALVIAGAGVFLCYGALGQIGLFG